MSFAINDNTLLVAFQNGDILAERALFDRFFEPLCLFAGRITTDIQQAEDIVAESFIKLIDKRGDFGSLPQLRSFLYRTVHNASINQVISKQRHQAIHEKIRYINLQEQLSDNALEAEMIRAELIKEIYDEVENLPDKCGQIFKMIFVGQMSTDEIAGSLGISVQTVRSQKARAIQLIRTALLKKNRISAVFLLYALIKGPWQA